MMRSLFTGVSGLRTHQVRMDVIGNNIANVNTVGYKASRMTFADFMSQRIAAARGDDMDGTGRAGRNPMQIGLGVNIGGIDNIMNQGAAQRTDRALDLTIQGQGFFIVEDNSGTYFTRAGNIDWNGYIFSINSMPLQGWGAIEDPERPGSFIIDRNSGLRTLETPNDIRFMDPSPTTLIDATGNLNIDDLVNGSIIRPVEFYCSIGNRWTADMRFTWHPPANHPDAPAPGPGVIYSDNTVSWWSFDFLPADEGTIDSTNQVMIFPDGDRSRGIAVNMAMGITDDNIREGDVGAPGVRGRIGFSPAELRDEETGTTIHPGGVSNFFIESPAPGGGAMLYRSELALFFSVPPLPPPSVLGDLGAEVSDAELGIDVPEGYNTGVIRLNMDALRQQMGERTTFQAFFADGNSAGTLQDVSIGNDGVITARYSNGEMRPLGQIPLASFRNPEGLERVGNNFWIPSANSGDWEVIHGDFVPGALEMSNVELAEEFTGMITTQRGFQANSRVITTSDEILQELVNLKR